MNITEYQNKKDELGIKGIGVTVTTKIDRIWRNKTTNEVVFTIPAGSKVHVDFSPQKHSNRIFIFHPITGEVKISQTINAHNWLTGISKPPTLKTLEKWSMNGVAKSVTGAKVEPDGFGPDGSPSWLLACSLI